MGRLFSVIASLAGAFRIGQNVGDVLDVVQARSSTAVCGGPPKGYFRTSQRAFRGKIAIAAPEVPHSS